MARNGRRTLALCLHAAAIAAAPIAIGGVHTPTAVLLYVPIVLAFAVQLRWRAHEGLGYRLPAIGWVLVAWTLATAAQLVPLPLELIAVLSPRTAAVRQAAAADAGGAVGWAPLSLAPSATARDLLRALAVLGTTLGVAGLVRVRARAAATLLTTIVATGVVLVFVAVVQQAFGIADILGFYAPQTTEGRRFFWSTFVNQNHFAAFLCLAAPLALGLALDRATPRPRAPLLVGAFAALAAGALLTLSRAGALVLVGELALFAVLWALANRGRLRAAGDEDDRRGRVGWPPIAGALAVVAAIGLIVALPRVLAEWRSLGDGAALSTYAKWATWPDIGRLVRSFPWTGVGAGAYAEVFPAFNTRFPDATFHYVENGALQLVADHGLPVAIALLLPGLFLVAVLVRDALRRPLLIGAAVGLVGVLVENLVDFSLAMPGVALPAAAVLGVLAGKSRRRRRRATARATVRADDATEAATEAAADDAAAAAGAPDASDDGRGRRRRTRIALAAAAVSVPLAVAASWIAFEHGLGRTRQAVAAGASGALAEAARWHPADPVVALAAGRRAEQDGDPAAAARHFARARSLAPLGLWPNLHALRAALARDDRETARAALRALDAGHGDDPRDRRKYLALLRGREDAAALLGPAVGWEPTAIVVAVGDLQRLGAARTSERLLRAGLDERPEDPFLLYALAELYRTRGLLDAADRVATRLLALHPARAEPYLALGDLALHRGDTALAEHLFREAVRFAPQDVQPLFRQAEALIALEEWGPLETVFRELTARARTPRERAYLAYQRSRAAERQGELKRALRFAREAVEEVPEHLPHLHQLARLLEALDRSASALTVYERILSISSDDRAAAAAVTRLRARR